MRKKKPKKKHYVIDKSMLPFGIKGRLEDNDYLASYNGSTCNASDNGIDTCGKSAVGCHIRIGENGKSCGMGQKPDDDLTEALCGDHHAEQSGNEEWFWIEKVYKPQRRRAYLVWKNTAMEK